MAVSRNCTSAFRARIVLSIESPRSSTTKAIVRRTDRAKPAGMVRGVQRRPRTRPGHRPREHIRRSRSVEGARPAGPRNRRRRDRTPGARARRSRSHRCGRGQRRSGGLSRLERRAVVRRASGRCRVAAGTADARAPIRAACHAYRRNRMGVTASAPRAAMTSSRSRSASAWNHERSQETASNSLSGSSRFFSSIARAADARPARASASARNRRPARDSGRAPVETRSCAAASSKRR